MTDQANPSDCIRMARREPISVAYQNSSTPASAFDLRDPDTIGSITAPTSSNPEQNNPFLDTCFFSHVEPTTQPAAGNAAESRQHVLPLTSCREHVVPSPVPVSLAQSAGASAKASDLWHKSGECDLESFLSDASNLCVTFANRSCSSSPRASPPPNAEHDPFESALPVPPSSGTLDSAPDSPASAPATPAPQMETLLDALIGQERLLDFAATGCKLKEQLAQDSRDDGFLRTLEAVAKIVKNKLYLARARNMESYFQGQYKISRAQVYRLLDCWAVIEGLDGFEEKPLKQRICRVIKKLAPEHEKRRILWKAVLEEHSATKGVSNFTSADIRAKHNELAKAGAFAGFQDVKPSATRSEKEAKRRSQEITTDDEDVELEPNACATTEPCLATSAPLALCDVKLEPGAERSTLLLHDVHGGQQVMAGEDVDTGLLMDIKREPTALHADATSCDGWVIGNSAVIATGDNVSQANASVMHVQEGLEAQRPPPRKRQKKNLAVTSGSTTTETPAAHATPPKAKRGRKPRSAAPAVHPYAALLESTPLSIGPMMAYAPVPIQSPGPATPGHLALVIQKEHETTIPSSVSSSSQCRHGDALQVKSEPPCLWSDCDARDEAQPAASSAPGTASLYQVSCSGLRGISSGDSTSQGSNSSSPVSLARVSSDHVPSTSARVSSVGTPSPTTVVGVGESIPSLPCHNSTWSGIDREIDYLPLLQTYGNTLYSAAGHHRYNPPHYSMGTMCPHPRQYSSSTHHQQHPYAQSFPALAHHPPLDPRHQPMYPIYPYHRASQAPVVYQYPPSQAQNRFYEPIPAPRPQPVLETLDDRHHEHQVHSAYGSPARRPLWTPYGDPWYS